MIATNPGLRVNGSTTDVPTRTRRVVAAMAAVSVTESGAILPSVVHTEW